MGIAIFMLLLGLLLLIGGGYLVYYSVQSIRQANVLNRPVALNRLKDHMGEAVAVHGEPELAGGDGGPYRFPVVWFCRKEQVYRSSGKSGSWRTVDSTERNYNFYLHFPDGGRIFVRNKPTERNGTGKNIDKESFFSRHRTVHEWFPLTRRLTVLGKIELTAEGGTLSPDEKLGMVLSVDDPKEAASKEYAKGWGGVAGVVTLAVVFIGILVAVAS
jgi:hypothetical protein